MIRIFWNGDNYCMSEHTHVPKCFGFAFGVIFSFSSLKMASGIHHIYVQLQCKIIYVKFEIKVGLWQYSNNFAMSFPFLFPVIPGNNNVSFPFPKFGNGKSTPVPGPKNWEWNFHSRSQNVGMQFIIPVPVPKVWEWAEPFPFPFLNVQKSFPLTPGTD